MAIYDERNRLSTALSAVPKALLAFGLAGGLWVVLLALGAVSLQVLTMLGV